jgi:hypothetical protein
MHAHRQQRAEALSRLSSFCALRLHANSIMLLLMCIISACMSLGLEKSCCYYFFIGRTSARTTAAGRQAGMMDGHAWTPMGRWLKPKSFLPSAAGLGVDRDRTSSWMHHVMDLYMTACPAARYVLASTFKCIDPSVRPDTMENTLPVGGTHECNHACM